MGLSYAPQVNDKEHVLDGVDESTPLLWVLRDHLGLVGTKYGCGIGQCGACTVHLNGAPIARARCRSARPRVSGSRRSKAWRGKDGRLHPLQAAWIDHDVPQCGYCQAGQLMSAAALLKQKPNPTDADIDAAMNGNICRCGTYPRIRKAIHAAAKQAHE